MQFKIGTTLFIGGNSQYHLKSGIQGLDSPAIRTGDGVYAGRDGGFLSGHFYGQRTIVIPGFYIGSDCEEAAQLRTDLMSFMRIRYAMPMVITDFGGNSYYTEGFVKDVKCNVTGPVAGDYQLTFLCPDPFLYKMTDPADVSSIWLDTSCSITSGSGSVTINNAGSVDIHPRITWSGQIKGFSITNTTTGETFAIDDTVPSGQTVIDFNKRTIMVGSTCYNSHRLSTSSWFSLVPGENALTFSNSTSGNNSFHIQTPKMAKAGI